MMQKLADTTYPIEPLLKQRWSPRAFAERPVEIDKLLSLWEAARWSASCTMVRNLYKVKGFPFRPERCCRKRTGPEEVSLTIKATTSNGRDKMTKAINAPTRSINCFASEPMNTT